MPELPELERLRRYLEPRIVGKTISAVTINRAECINVPPAVYERAVVGRTVSHVWRRGKTAIVDLTEDVSLLIHLALGGEVLVKDSAEHDAEKTQVVLGFADGTALHFHQLMLGNVHVFPTYHLAETRIGTLGPDALDQLPEPAELWGIYGTRGSAIKAILLDQSLLCGLGNTYADEVLFRARISPESPGKALNTDDFERLHDAIQAVLAEALDEGRPEFDRQVHGREGEPCPVCGGPIRMIRIQNRATYLCRKCQRKKRVRKRSSRRRARPK